MVGTGLPRGIRMHAATIMAAALLLVACSSTPPATTPTAAAPTPQTSSPTPDAPVDAPTAAAMQALLDERVADGYTPGLTAAVVSPSGQWAGAAGVDGLDAALTADSASCIASITKPFVAAEAVLLAQSGALDLDARVDSYVQLPFSTGQATVRMLLDQTAGLPDWFDPPMPDLDRVWSTDDVLSLYDDTMERPSAPGTYFYNNLNYVVLGAVLTSVTGTDVAELVTNDIIAPSGAPRIWFQTYGTPAAPLARAGASDPDNELFIDRESPHLPSTAFASVYGPAGAIAADAHSVAQWGYAFTTGAVIDQAGVEAMSTPGGGSRNYGLGLMLQPYGVLHLGNAPGYRTVWLATPDNISVAVLLVQDSLAGEEAPDGPEIIDIARDLAAAVTPPAG